MKLKALSLVGASIVGLCLSANAQSYTFTTLAGKAGVTGTNDGVGAAASFSYPSGVAVDGAGNVYVADLYNHTIRKITPSGVITTLAGLGGIPGSTNGTGSAARFNQPIGVAVDGAGNVYVADYQNYTIRKISSGAVVTTLAGLAGRGGTNDGIGAAARFAYPSGVAVDGAGNVYVADDGNHTIRKITSGGGVTTLAGLGGNPGSTDGTGSAARFHSPNGVAMDSAGNLYVADAGNNEIRKGLPNNGAPIITAQPQGQAVGAGSNVTLSVTVVGTLPLKYQWGKGGVNISKGTNSTLLLNSVTAADSAGYSVVVSNSAGTITSATAYLSVLTDGANGNQPAQVSFPTAPTPSGGVDSLVVVTHGWEPAGDSADVSWVNTMAGAIQQRSPANWFAYPFVWKAQASGIPELALINAWILGTGFGQAVAQQHWTRVHLIAHSAGARFIESVASQIKEASPSTIVQCTFLDPYHSLFLVGIDDNYGMHANWSDCYFTQDWTGGGTGGNESYPYNVDVDWTDPHYQPLAYGSTVIASSTHEWSHGFYMQTITNLAGGWCGANYGFRLSAEDGGETDQATHPTGNGSNPTVLCGPPGAIPSPNLPLAALKITLDNLQHAISSGVNLLGEFFTMSTSSSPFTQQIYVGSSGGIWPFDSQSGANAGTPAWLAVGLPVTNAVNFVQFDSAFTDTNAAQGLLTVYWNTNQVGTVDERVASSGLQTYQFALPGAVTNGLYTLSFRLDAFNNTTSSIMVTNVTTGFVGITTPAALGISLTNNAPIMRLTGASNYNYLVESSTNLVDWTPTALLVNTNGMVLFNDPDWTNYSARFYRVLLP